jgi:hypothetical protein
MSDERATDDRLADLDLPDPDKLKGRVPNCSWCGRQVDAWGDTCDWRCYDQWVRKILPRREQDGGDVWTAKSIDYRPNPEGQQPWTRPGQHRTPSV